MSSRATYLIGAVLAASFSIWYALLGSQSSSQIPHPGPFPGRNNTILFFADAHPGLSNVHVATSHALLVEYPELDVHFASFAKVSERIGLTSKFALEQNPKAKAIKFHPVKGKAYAEMLKIMGHDVSNSISRPGLRGIDELTSKFQDYLMPWTAEDYIAIFQDILRIIEDVDPLVIVVDPMLGPAMDALKTSQRNHVVLSPNTLKDNFVAMQPWGSMFWKYPALGSGYSYPVPWHLIPTNIYLNLRFIYAVFVTPLLSEKKAYLKAHGITKPIDVFTVYDKDYLWLTPAIPEAEFPMEILPSNLVLCGPIFRSAAPAEEQDPELAAWLARAPTVLINLGSTVDYDEYGAGEIVAAIKNLLATSPVQVLWKFNKRKDFSRDVFAVVADEISQGRLRLEKWLSIDPAALMETGNIAVSVHHGGANCYFEAFGVGIPQIILPLWVDLYDYATRIEYLGIGVAGSPSSAPNWTSHELSSAFTRILDGGEESVKIKAKAAELGVVARKAGGRFKAAEEISKLARRP